jgi:hypothetical protein
MHALIAAVGFGTGILHAEWILTDDGPALVECAGRCPGDRIIDLIDLAYGTQLRVDVIDLLRGQAVDLSAEPRRGSAIRFLTAAPGVVTRVDGLERASSLPGVEAVQIDVAIGAETRAWASSWDRPGYILVTAAGGLQARELARTAAATVEIVTG